MSPPRLPAGLSELAPTYDALICDVWGVIHNGRRAFPEPCRALAAFKAEGGAVVLVSNSPRPLPGFTAQLRSLGVPDAAWSAIVTSGDATQALLRARAPGPVLAIGPPRDAQLYAGLDLELAASVEDAAFICCTGPYDDGESDPPEFYAGLLERAKARGLTFLCANPDRVVHVGDQLIWCAGAIADVYEAMGGEVVMAGKPYPPVYDLARAKLAEALGRAPDDARILVIGDGLQTDVAGANGQGLDCLFVTGGIHGADAAGPDGRLDAARLETLLNAAGAEAAFAMHALKW